MTSVEISSPVDPVFPTKYPANTFCEWLVHDECAEGFTIKTTRFEIERHPRCVYDYLAIANEDQSYNSTFCNQRPVYDDESSSYESSNSSFSSYSSYYSYSGSWTDDFEELGAGSEFFVPGDSIRINFASDNVYQFEGFQLTVTPKRTDPQCIVQVNEPLCIFPYNSDQSIMMKTWKIETQDKLVPFSNYAGSFERGQNEDGESFANRCAAKCVDTPGCFKFKYDGQTCDLRGNEVENANAFSFAINGEDCPNDPSNLLWRDSKATTQIFCLFYGIEAAENYLDYLRAENGQMTQWQISESGNERRMTRRWSFSEATERPSSFGHWYTFVSTIYFRKYLVPVNGAQVEPARKRRDTDENEEILNLVNEEVQDFINNLNVGDAEVLETEVLETELENMEPIDDTDTNRMIYAYTTMKDLLDSRMIAEGTRRRTLKIKQFGRVIRRFSWMYEHSSDSISCDSPADSLFDTYGWTTPEINESDICGSIVSLMESTMSFYDHNVCLDQIDLNENREAKRRYDSIDSDFRRSKLVFNRLLRGLKCSERLAIN
ncbi:Oidioi.mRNA.OKI2018_I69.chr1.g518.t1.cds [Oikopleura dioica]|uniref:Oidioi.mRNA.OKI2018_I69.chr1.g518.t1.cds n=1 Tax=Oikopleura dioica TaxID=34765 RepID=A0ABN7SQ52_OIKDI|nr:Oidioi.mRNA.OKI2018_I69.chr1.g518.t1.cds [Oikopleura dioica]